MTGRLGLMMKLHDAQVADDVRRMAELGYFDTEFTMYGCVYMENGKRYYKISPNADDIYSFTEKSNLNNIFPGNVYQYTKKCPVPAGMKEVIAQEVKVELAKKLSEDFPTTYMETLEQFAKDITDDSAADYLWQRVDDLEGVFDIEKLRRFEEQMEYLYTCRKITWATFKALRDWLKDERKSMLENFETKDIFEKTVYGMMYVDGERLRYVENARMEYVYEKMYDIEGKGGVVTPIYKKTFWYNYTYRLADVMQDFKKELRAYYSKRSLDELELVRRTDAHRDLFIDVYRNIKANYNDKAVETLLRYSNRWGIYRRDNIDLEAI
ncbi:MAG: hypothetical protein UDB11_02425 [Peptococcaceae bacterium]|nr:hypothetical protein [Peptococcaceae bacterium]